LRLVTIAQVQGRISQEPCYSKVTESGSEPAHEHVFVARPTHDKSADEDIPTGEHLRACGNVLNGRGRRQTRKDIGRAGVTSTIIRLVAIYPGGSTGLVLSPNHHRVTRDGHCHSKKITCLRIGSCK